MISVLEKQKHDPWAHWPPSETILMNPRPRRDPVSEEVDGILTNRDCALATTCMYTKMNTVLSHNENNSYLYIIKMGNDAKTIAL